MAHPAPESYGATRTLPRFLSVNEVAAVLGVSRKTVYRLVNRGALSPVRVGSRMRFRLSELDEHLERSRESP
jgi:excisionase family DNA binding protein